jgi:hypothetical protein
MPYAPARLHIPARLRVRGKYARVRAYTVDISCLHTPSANSYLTFIHLLQSLRSDTLNSWSLRPCPNSTCPDVRSQHPAPTRFAYLLALTPMVITYYGVAQANPALLHYAIRLEATLPDVRRPKSGEPNCEPLPSSHRHHPGTVAPSLTAPTLRPLHPLARKHPRTLPDSCPLTLSFVGLHPSSHSPARDHPCTTVELTSSHSEH